MNFYCPRFHFQEGRCFFCSFSFIFSIPQHDLNIEFAGLEVQYRSLTSSKIWTQIKQQTIWVTQIQLLGCCYHGAHVFPSNLFVLDVLRKTSNPSAIRLKNETPRDVNSNFWSLVVQTLKNKNFICSIQDRIEQEIKIHSVDCRILSTHAYPCPRIQFTLGTIPNNPGIHHYPEHSARREGLSRSSIIFLRSPHNRSFFWDPL